MKYLLLALILVSCGKSEDCANSINSNNCSTERDTADSFMLRGSIVGAFEIEVDGENYSDVEDFYSEEIVRLTKEAASAGYENATVELDAEIGFKDLTKDMTVFVAPVQNRGYASKTKVLGDDTFAVKFPSDAANDVYQIKATKRVNLKITDSEGQVKLWCYNFSAVDAEVSYEQIDKPIILSKFETKLTQYACQVKKDGGIEVPAPGTP